jgi:hypothetical protein
VQAERGAFADHPHRTAGRDRQGRTAGSMTSFPIFPCVVPFPAILSARLPNPGSGGLIVAGRKAEKRVSLAPGQTVAAGDVSIRLIRVHSSGSILIAISEGPIQVRRPRIPRPPGTMFPKVRK